MKRAGRELWAVIWWGATKVALRLEYEYASARVFMRGGGELDHDTCRLAYLMKRVAAYNRIDCWRLGRKPVPLGQRLAEVSTAAIEESIKRARDNMAQFATITAEAAAKIAYGQPVTIGTDGKAHPLGCDAETKVSISK